MHKLRV